MEYPIILPSNIGRLRSKWEENVEPPKKLVLVQWTGLAPEDTLWEDWEGLKQIYHLEDKVFFQKVKGMITPWV